MRKIGLDVDDVICDFWGTATDIFNHKYKVNALKSDFTTYSSVLDVYSITYPEFVKTIVDEGIFEQMKPYKGIPEVVQRLKDSGSDITLITSRGFHPNSLEVTRAFFKLWNIPYDSLYIKHPGKTKADYIDGSLDLFVDDLPSNLIDLKASGKVANLALISQPWNATEKRFERHSHLKDVYNRHLKAGPSFSI